MKELLYLKDEQLKQLIANIFTSYKETFSDAKKILDKYSIGIAHHKVIHLISMYEGITISELLKKLKVTKQSLNRVLNDLIKIEAIVFKKDDLDSRIKHVFLNDKGKKIFEEVFSIQKKRIYNAFLNSTSNEVLNFENVMPGLLIIFSKIIFSVLLILNSLSFLSIKSLFRSILTFLNSIILTCSVFKVLSKIFLILKINSFGSNGFGK